MAVLAHYRGNFFQGFSGLCSQFTYLVGYHCEPPPHFAGAGGFDGSVQGQQVGLLSHRANGADNTANLLGLGFQIPAYLRGAGHLSQSRRRGFHRKVEGTGSFSRNL